MRSAAVAMACMILLAGCAQDDPPTEEKEHSIEVEAGAGKGVIRGVVVDTGIVPIAGASVRLGSEDGPEQVTNEAGEFGFGDLEPGYHNLFVDAEGFGAVQQQTEVKADVKTPPVVMVQLTPDPSELPDVLPLYFQGYIDCSISTPAYRVAVCGIANPGGVFQDEFMIVHEDLPADPSFIQAEMVWKSTQQAGEAMMFTMEHSASNGGELAPQAQGASPLVIRANQTAIENGPYAGHIMHRVFNFEHPATTPPVPVCGIPNPVHGGTMCAKGFGATIQQDFEIFTHVFLRATPQEGWQFSVDGEPILR